MYLNNTAEHLPKSADSEELPQGQQIINGVTRMRSRSKFDTKCTNLHDGQD